jgi:hypothetical protein
VLLLLEIELEIRMSDVIAAVRVNGELLVYIDFDRPVWQNATFKELASTPSLENFLVDGILGSASQAILSKYGISKNFSEDDFWGASDEVQKAREAIYAATDLDLEYIYYDDRDPLIDGDLLKFTSEASIQKVSVEDFDALVKPIR